MSPTRRDPEPDGGRTTNDRLKLELRDLAIKMNVLLQEARRLCRRSELDSLTAMAAAALDRIEKNNDLLLVLPDDEPPGPVVVRVKIPDSDEPVRLEAVWDDDLKACRLTNVPIGLAAVARAIDASLAEGEWSDTVSFRWSAVLAEMEHLIEF